MWNKKDSVLDSVHQSSGQCFGQVLRFNGVTIFLIYVIYSTLCPPSKQIFITSFDQSSLFTNKTTVKIVILYTMIQTMFYEEENKGRKGRK